MLDRDRLFGESVGCFAERLGGNEFSPHASVIPIQEVALTSDRREELEVTLVGYLPRLDFCPIASELH